MANRREDDNPQEREDASTSSARPAPENKFLVGIDNRDLIHVYGMNLCMPKKAALNLAVWIVALADPECNEFKPLLDAALES